MNASDLSDYTGQLMLSTELRVTDQAGSVPATMENLPFTATAPCVLTADPTLGGQCDLDTTADSLVPGMVPEGARTIWELGPVRVYDGGPDGDTSTVGNSVFATQGVFVP